MAVGSSRKTSSPGNIARVARRPRPRVGWSNASNDGGGTCAAVAAAVAAAASLLALRELVDDILAQCLGAARQFDRLEVHADGGNEDESDAAETNHEIEVRLSGSWHGLCGVVGGGQLRGRQCRRHVRR